ncbi:bifunctional UDP-N-acetylglucosamine diphosphorylase/glucosamine-1-phosphate N-acetyltransferase GlmU [Kroppenstedtia pulmonis]|uniref:Bifunctional protein GlmU n=1 Tax=Kroppenstedtia pulmonis TaxID=1380685 RepID=A0A7D3XHC1_9BACL|nr:bifunctional UDP-N-acetylglucosamine diphosphorylase/glucosamine-1-phosphate N-acetyltransferase GlmU [Kroppenstedtia pulmonis]QKG83079.1 bifunctional UDP-N-acetylglucosamine diphosphorylase/glucosamine-1-phosphate N-acetyltransferase GlmU [Kroppenstedtia pulmonis]
MENLYAVILAAGKGTRMKSGKHKVLHPVCGKPIIEHIVDNLNRLGTEETVVVVGYEAHSVQSHLGDRVAFAEQKEQLGTAHAVVQAEPLLSGYEGVTLVLNGDHPLFTVDTLTRVLEDHHQSGAAATILTADMSDPTGYGRVIRQRDGSVEKVVEHKDATESERKVTEINTGTFCFDNQLLWNALSKVGNDNAQGEYYLPDVIRILREEGHLIRAHTIRDSAEAMGINDRVQLAEAEKEMRRRILIEHMRNGVTIIDPDHTYVDVDVTIEADTVIHPGTCLRGQTRIGAGCEIGPYADLEDLVVEDGVQISHSVLRASHLKEHANVGPFAYIRPGSSIGKETKVGCFVEVKNSDLGDKSKFPHLSYIGDADIGEKVNFGCGAITVNYDGKQKHRTQVEDGAFIGCNVNLIAPVTVKKGAYIAAGSTITDEVPEDALAIARQRQTNKRDYVQKLKNKDRS